MAHEHGDVVDALAELCKRLDIKCLVQVGASDGYEAEIVRVATGCRAVAIEGDPRGSTRYEQLEYYRAIIGEADGPVTFYMNESQDLSGTVKRGAHESAVESQQSRLDTFCSEHQISGVDALIIDTEGSTLQVLEGAGALLDSLKVVYAECQNDMSRPGVSLLADVSAVLEAAGMKRHDGLPSYDAVSQGNYTWIRSTTE